MKILNSKSLKISQISQENICVGVFFNNIAGLKETSELIRNDCF